jgi:putative alpha-1,2-mannosidase
MKKVVLIITIPFFTYSQNNLTHYVKPLTGTQKMGHTYPGATVPFGMVQLSPDTDTLAFEKDGKFQKEVYQYCAGYHNEDK